MRAVTWCVFFLALISLTLSRKGDDEDYDPYTTMDPKLREPSPCEVCKFFVTELKRRLDESGKYKQIIETGHGLEKKKIYDYRTSELRLTEALLEPHVCENILKYNVHAEREGSNRYAKGQSETMSTLHGLVNKGVEVKMDIPYELWDETPAEISKMHRACFHLAEDHEEDIEDWYYNYQDKDLLLYLCADKYLPKFPENSFNKDCLLEEWDGKRIGEKDDEDKTDQEESDGGGEEKKKKKKKKAKKDRSQGEGVNMKGDGEKPEHSEL